MSAHTALLNHTPLNRSQRAMCQSSYLFPILPLYTALPLNNVTDLFNRGQQLGKVLLRVSAPCGGGTDLKLTQTSLEVVDGLSKGELVSHLLDGVDVAHAVLGQVLPGLQHATVAACLL